MSDHVCTVRKRVYRTTSAPVSTTRTPSLPQEPAIRPTRANISTAIRLTSQWIRHAAITQYDNVSVFFKIINIHRRSTIRYSGVICGAQKTETT